MNRIAVFVSEHIRLAWGVALALILVVSLLAGAGVRLLLAEERLDGLATDARRQSIEIMSQTLNGNVMGALDLLGLIEPAIKYDAQGFMPPNGVQTSTMLETIGQSYGADGVFVVGTEGVLTSSWNRGGKPSTGMDVRFRPYFQMAQQGRNNVYAAVSLARGDRSLYFATPVHETASRESRAVGAVVARTDLERVEGLLRDKSDIALLLSPQGVVFAGNRPEWIGNLAGKATSERLAAIRQLKQFGAMFENRDPPPLPFDPADGLISIQGQDYALASARVLWNDPSGDWTLVLAEDLSRTVPVRNWLLSGLATGGVLLLFGLLLLGVLRGHHARMLSSRLIEDYARAQEAAAARKSDLAEASRRFQRAKTPDELAQTFLAECHRLLAALHGLIYECDPEGGLRLIGSYADDGRAAPRLKNGEGLLGQCVSDHQPRLLELSEEEIAITSGLGNHRPAAVLMAPLLLDDDVLGVAEIALLSLPAPHLHEMFDEMASLLALNLEILRRHGSGGQVTPEARS